MRAFTLRDGLNPLWSRVLGATKVKGGRSYFLVAQLLSLWYPDDMLELRESADVC